MKIYSGQLNISGNYNEHYLEEEEAKPTLFIM